MLYELIAVVRPGNLVEVKEIARTAGNLILRSGGTIRGITNWGISTLPKRTVKHQASYTAGHYFVMRFDSSSQAQEDVRTTLGLDPRMIRFSSVKLGDGTLDGKAGIGRIGGGVGWSEREERR